MVSDLNDVARNVDLAIGRLERLRDSRPDMAQAEDLSVALEALRRISRNARTRAYLDAGFPLRHLFPTPGNLDFDEFVAGLKEGRWGLYCKLVSYNREGSTRVTESYRDVAANRVRSRKLHAALGGH